MATVRITKDLTSKIINKISEQFNTRRAAIKKNITEGFAPLMENYKEALLEVILEQHNMPRETYDAIPAGWCHRTKTLKAIRLNNVNTEVLPTVSFNPSIAIPSALQYGNECLRLEHDSLFAFSNYAFLANQQLSALAKEESEVKHEANRLLAGCGSLKQALDAWPHLMQLLPNDVVREHNRVSEKRQRATPIAIDSDKLTAAVVKGKMAEASLLDK